jgi:hypothetical protein
MSGGEDFLSRWSRRTRAVAEAEPTEEVTKAPPRERSASPETRNAEPAKIAAGPPQPAPGPGEVRMDPPPLPALESITAETDIRAFLAPGVPADLARAALRRAWSADPAIRDFIGLSENLSETAWDFSAPESMAGFGPLEMTEDLRRAVTELFTSAPESGSQHIENTEVFAPGEGEPDASSKQDIAFSQDEKASARDDLSIRGQLPHVSSEPDAVQQEPLAPPQQQITVRRGHGRALPK